MSTPRRQRPRTRKRVKNRTVPEQLGEVKRGIELIVRGVVARGGRVLLCRNERHGYFYLPGGHIEPLESARTALAREFLEETGLAVSVGELALVTEGAFTRTGKKGRKTHHEINLVFHAEPAGGGWDTRQVDSREKGISFAWIEPAEAPELDIRPLSAKAFIAAGGQRTGVEWVSEIA